MKSPPLFASNDHRPVPTAPTEDEIDEEANQTAPLDAARAQRQAALEVKKKRLEELKARRHQRATNSVSAHGLVPTAPTEDELDEEAILRAVEPTAPTEAAMNHDDDTDARAREEAARHRFHASNLVRDHLEHHAANNPGASSDYVTWIATLHPENASVTIDQRFLVPGNPWWTIYEDVKNHHRTPLATALPVAEPLVEPPHEDGELGEPLMDRRGARGRRGGDDPNIPHDIVVHHHHNNHKRSVTTITHTQTVAPAPKPHVCQTCNPLALALGLAIGLPLAVAVLQVELVAWLLLHLPAALCYHAAEAFSAPNLCTCLLYSIFTALYGMFALFDALVLVASVGMTEMVGAAAWWVGFLTGGCLWAHHLHQLLRKTCHGIRIRFRHDSSPSRSFWQGRNNEEEH